MISRNDPCFCGSGKKWKKCHYPALPESSLKDHYLRQYGIIIKNQAEIEKIRSSCKIAALILNELCLFAKEGVTTNELDTLSQKLHAKYNAIPASLGYGEPPFPKTICTSLNEVICHGIPDDTPLKNGDILNIDVTTIIDGCFGDTSRMVLIGNVSLEKAKLVQVTKECLEKAISICKPGLKLFEIGNAIDVLASKEGFSVVDQFVGHGTGLHFHEPPQIPHHKNKIDIPPIEGMTFTIEPMINLGCKEAVIDPIDRWTARTRDGKPSAQWEHTLLITSSGCEVLTKWD